MLPFQAKLDPNRDLILRFFAEAVGKTVALFLALLLARSLEVTGYAAIGNANLIVAATLPILSFGLGFTLVRITAGLTKSAEISMNYYSSLFIAGCGSMTFSLFMWVFSNEVTEFFFDSNIWINFVRLIGIYSLFTVFELLTLETLRARQFTGAASAIQIVAAFINLAFCLTLSMQESLTPINTLCVLTFVKLLTTITAHSILVIRKQITIQIKVDSWEKIRNAIVSGVPFAVSGFGTWLIEHGDRFVLTSIMGQSDFGKYLATLTMLSIISICGAPFWYLLFPKLAKAQNDKNHTDFIIEGREALTKYLITIAPIIIFVTLSLPTLLPILTNVEYQISSNVTLILASSLFLIQASTPWEYACIVNAEPKSYLKRTLIFGLLGIGVGALLVPHFHVLGAALSSLLARLALSLSLYKLAARSGYGRSLLPTKEILACILLASILTIAFSYYSLQFGIDKQRDLWVVITSHCLGFVSICVFYYCCYRLCITFARCHKK